ncbi:hypothetical protein ABPG74_014465 [Tetrahymena malaccensis]
MRFQDIFYSLSILVNFIQQSQSLDKDYIPQCPQLFKYYNGFVNDKILKIISIPQTNLAIFMVNNQYYFDIELIVIDISQKRSLIRKSLYSQSLVQIFYYEQQNAVIVQTYQEIVLLDLYTLNQIQSFFYGPFDGMLIDKQSQSLFLYSSLNIIQVSIKDGSTLNQFQLDWVIFLNNNVTNQLFQISNLKNQDAIQYSGNLKPQMFNVMDSDDPNRYILFDQISQLLYIMDYDFKIIQQFNPPNGISQNDRFFGKIKYLKGFYVFLSYYDPIQNPYGVHGIYLYNEFKNEAIYNSLDHPNQIRIEIVESFQLNSNIYICFLFNTQYVMNFEGIDDIIKKYKYHRYECNQYTLDFVFIQKNILDDRQLYLNGLNQQPLRCGYHSLNKYLVCIEMNGLIHKWSVPSFQIIQHSQTNCLDTFVFLFYEEMDIALIDCSQNDLTVYLDLESLVVYTLRENTTWMISGYLHKKLNLAIFNGYQDNTLYIYDLNKPLLNSFQLLWPINTDQISIASFQINQDLSKILLISTDFFGILEASDCLINLAQCQQKCQFNQYFDMSLEKQSLSKDFGQGTQVNPFLTIRCMKYLFFFSNEIQQELNISQYVLVNVFIDDSSQQKEIQYDFQNYEMRSEAFILTNLKIQPLDKNKLIRLNCLESLSIENAYGLEINNFIVNFNNPALQNLQQLSVSNLCQFQFTSMMYINITDSKYTINQISIQNLKYNQTNISQPFITLDDVQNDFSSLQIENVLIQECQIINNSFIYFSNILQDQGSGLINLQNLTFNQTNLISSQVFTQSNPIEINYNQPIQINIIDCQFIGGILNAPLTNYKKSTTGISISAIQGNLNIQNSQFYDNQSTGFYNSLFIQIEELSISQCLFKNNTSQHLLQKMYQNIFNSFLQIKSSKIYFNNNTFSYGISNYQPILQAQSLSQNFNVTIENCNFENSISLKGSLIQIDFLQSTSFVKLRNNVFQNIKIQEEGNQIISFSNFNKQENLFFNQLDMENNNYTNIYSSATDCQLLNFKNGYIQIKNITFLLQVIEQPFQEYMNLLKNDMYPCFQISIENTQALITDYKFSGYNSGYYLSSSLQNNLILNQMNCDTLISNMVVTDLQLQQYQSLIISQYGFLNITQSKLNNIFKVNLQNKYQLEQQSQSYISTFYTIFEITQSQFQNILCPYCLGGIFYFEESNGQINNSLFFNDTSIAGGSIYFQNLLEQTSIINCNFEQNQSLEGNGGAISLYQDGEQIFKLIILHSNFSDCTSQNYGGAITILQQFYKKQNDNLVKLNNLKFINNKAKIGGALYYQNIIPVQENIFYNNNYAQIFGTNFYSGFPTSLKIINNKQITYQSDQTSFIPNFRSGDTLQEIQIQFYDQNDQKVIIQEQDFKNTWIEIDHDSYELGCNMQGVQVAQYLQNKNYIKIPENILTGRPQSAITLNIYSDQIYQIQNNQILQSNIIHKIKINFRDCLLGEIKVESIQDTFRKKENKSEKNIRMKTLIDIQKTDLHLNCSKSGIQFDSANISRKLAKQNDSQDNDFSSCKYQEQNYAPNVVSNTKISMLNSSIISPLYFVRQSQNKSTLLFNKRKSIFNAKSFNNIPQILEQKIENNYFEASKQCQFSEINDKPNNNLVLNQFQSTSPTIINKKNSQKSDNQQIKRKSIFNSESLDYIPEITQIKIEDSSYSDISIQDQYLEQVDQNINNIFVNNFRFIKNENFQSNKTNNDQNAVKLNNID